MRKSLLCLIMTVIATPGAFAETGVSNTIQLWINAISGPVGATVFTGEQVSFSVTTTGHGPFTYQWEKNGGQISGATGATYAVSSAQLTDAGEYACAATSAGGVAITSNVANLVVLQLLTIQIQPTDQTRQEGQGATFFVQAVGVNPLTYQWRKAGEDILGANSASYTIGSVVAGDAGNYTCFIQDAASQELESNAATLVVVPVGTYPMMYLDYVSETNPNEISGRINPNGYVLTDLLTNPGSLPAGKTYADITTLGIRFILGFSPYTNIAEDDTAVAVTQNGNSTPDSVYNNALVNSSFYGQIRPYFLVSGSTTKYYLSNALVKIQLTYGGTGLLAVNGTSWDLDLRTPLPPT